MGYYVFVDNSNVWIEGKYASAVKKGMVSDICTAHDRKISDNSWKARICPGFFHVVFEGRRFRRPRRSWKL